MSAWPGPRSRRAAWHFGRLLGFATIIGAAVAAVVLVVLLVS